MYLNQKIKKSVVIVAILLVSVFSFTLMAQGDKECTAFNGTSVENIYESIRNSGPKYEYEESIVTFENKGMTMVCSLAIPQTSTKCPIVITLVGFCGTREGDSIPGNGEKSFQRISRILAEQGIASMRIDFRGSGDSDGDYSMTTFSTQISDTRAAVRYINKNLKHRVNVKSIGILGFSQGGIIGISTALKEKRVRSLVLWSTPAHTPHDYEGVLSKEGIKAGLALEQGGSIILPFAVDGTYLWDVTLGKGFFEELFTVDSLADIRDFRMPVMYVCGKQDIIIWPQPAIGQTFMKYHKGYEKLVVLDADHSLKYWEGPEPETYDNAIYWSTAWFIKTL